MEKQKRVAIIGAGASGLMCVCMLPQNCAVTVFEKNTSAGKKLLMTGKSKCNITNLVEKEEFLKSVVHNAQFVANSLHGFSSIATMFFFKSLGIDMRVEEGNRVFPATGGAAAIKHAMQNHAKSRGVEFVFDFAINDIKKTAGGFELIGNKQSRFFDVVIIATGGVSYPITGSTGDGFAFARKFGHKVIAPRASLCGLQLAKATGLDGVSVQCCVQVLDASFAPLTDKETGSMLFTKNGVSGPAIFRTVARYKQQTIGNHVLQIDFIPSLSAKELEEKIAKNKREKLFFVLRRFMPTSVADWVAKSKNLPAAKICGQLTKQEINKIHSALCAFRVAIKDFEDINFATITRGGIDVSEIDSNTMESKIIPNLYFIGETLDVDALSGGFNLQIAFSTASACAKALQSDTIIG